MEKEKVALGWFRRLFSNFFVRLTNPSRSLLGLLLTLCIPATLGEPNTAPPTKIHMALVQIDNLLDSPDKGMLAYINQRILELADIQAEFQLVPSNRDSFLLNTQQVDVAFPNLGRSKKLGVLYSDTIIHADRFIFTPPGHPAMRSIDELENKRLGLVVGWAYKQAIHQAPNIQITQLTSMKSALLMLHSGRLDAVIGTQTLISLVSKALNLPMPSYSPMHPIQTMEMNYLLRDDPEGNKLLTKFNQAIAKFRASEDLSRFGVY